MNICHMNKRIEYHIGFLKDDGTSIVPRLSLHRAGRGSETLGKVLHVRAKDASLQINLNGIDIRTLRSGEFGQSSTKH
jgi:hypothetical protein